MALNMIILSDYCTLFSSGEGGWSLHWFIKIIVYISELDVTTTTISVFVRKES